MDIVEAFKTFPGPGSKQNVAKRVGQMKRKLAAAHVDSPLAPKPVQTGSTAPQMGKTSPPRNNIQQAQHLRKAKRDDKGREKETLKEATVAYFAVKQGKVSKQSAEAFIELKSESNQPKMPRRLKRRLHGRN